MPHIVWTRYFLEAQGFDVQDWIVYQDNQSAILLEKNGKGWSSKQTRHINIRYFFVKDRIDNGEVKVEYCPTKKMLADYFTKPLQGALFQTMRNHIMNHNPYGHPFHMDYRSVLEHEERKPSGIVEWTKVQGKKKVSHNEAVTGVTNSSHEPIHNGVIKSANQDQRTGMKYNDIKTRTRLKKLVSMTNGVRMVG